MSDQMQKLDRREFFARAAALGAAAVGASALLSACEKKGGGAAGGGAAPAPAPVAKACDDVSHAKPAEAKQRETLGYVSKTAKPEQNCANCVHYKPGSPCGGCAMNLGPVAPEGWCKVWAKKG